MAISKKIQFMVMAFAVAAMSSNVQAQRGSNRGDGDGNRGRGGSQAESRSSSQRGGSSSGGSRAQSDNSGGIRAQNGVGSRFQRNDNGIQIQRDNSGGITIQRGGERDQRGSSGHRDQRSVIENRDQRGTNDNRDQRDRGENRGRGSSDVSDAIQDLRSRINNSRGNSNFGNRDGNSRFDGRNDFNDRNRNFNSGRNGTIYRGGSYYRGGYNNPGITIGGRDGVRLSIGNNGLNVGPGRSYLGNRYGGRPGWSHFMPRYGSNRGGAFYRNQNQYYYSPNYYSQSVYSQPNYPQGTVYQQPTTQQSQEPVQIEFGQRKYVAELADQLQVLSNELCLDLYENYSGSPNFKATYTDAYAIMSFAKYLQAEGTSVPQAQLIEQMSDIDSVFHKVDEEVATWTSQQRKKISELDTPTRMEFLEETIHHLMYDIGVPVEDVDHTDDSTR